MGGSLKYTSEKGKAQLQEIVKQTANERGFSGNQNYEQLKAECLSNGILFEDPEFPADSLSIDIEDIDEQEIHWKRPSVPMIFFDFNRDLIHFIHKQSTRNF